MEPQTQGAEDLFRAVSAIPFFGIKGMADALASVPESYEELRKIVIAKVAQQYKVSEALLSKMSPASIINFVRYYDRHVALFNAIPPEILNFVDSIDLTSDGASDEVRLYKDIETPHVKLLMMVEITVDYNEKSVKANLRLYKYNENGRTNYVFDADLQPGGAIPLADVLLHYLDAIPKGDP